jgi:hypothetical protein
MAASSNTTWSKGFSGNPAAEARGDASLAELIGAIGAEWVTYPTGGDDALSMTRREALARTLWTRGVIDGDMTAIKLLVELLAGKGGDAGDDQASDGSPLLNADRLAAAEAAVRAWYSERGFSDGAAEERTGDGNV